MKPTKLVSSFEVQQELSMVKETIGLEALAKKTNTPRTELTLILEGDIEPTNNVLDLLGYQRIILYKKVENDKA
jgi:hypothetical protein